MCMKVESICLRISIECQIVPARVQPQDLPGDLPIGHGDARKVRGFINKRKICDLER